MTRVLRAALLLGGVAYLWKVIAEAIAAHRFQIESQGWEKGSERNGDRHQG